MLTFEQIKELIELVGRHGLGGVEVERAGFRLKIAGLPAVQAAPAPALHTGLASPFVLSMPHGGEALPSLQPSAGALPASAALPPTGGAAPAAAAGAAAQAPGAASASNGRYYLTSPIVGTFYQAPSPDAPPFVEVGSKVRKGQVVCIIEAMKLMNEIECDVDGTVSEVYPQNAQAVEYGEPLFAIALATP